MILKKLIPFIQKILLNYTLHFLSFNKDHIKSPIHSFKIRQKLADFLVFLGFWGFIPSFWGITSPKQFSGHKKFSDAGSFWKVPDFRVIDTLSKIIIL